MWVKVEGDMMLMLEVVCLSVLLCEVVSWVKLVFLFLGVDVFVKGVLFGLCVGEFLGKLEEEWLVGDFNVEKLVLFVWFDVLL